MKLSIIIPNWNGKKFLKSCLDSLKAQTLQDFDIWLIDNGSTDGSKGFIKKNYPEIKIIEFSTNQGFAKAVNAGIKNSKGEYIVILNNDTIADFKYLEELVKNMEANQEIGSACGKILFQNQPRIINDIGDGLCFYGIAFQRGSGAEDKGQYINLKKFLAPVQRRLFIGGPC